MIIIKEKRKSTPIYIMRNDVENATGGDNETYITEAELNSKLSDYPTIDEVGAQLSTKQDNLISGDNIKTINGESVLGDGNLVVSADVDLSDYYNKREINNILGDYATIQVMSVRDGELQWDINRVNDKVDNIVVPSATSQLTNDSGYITESDMNSKLLDYPTRGEVNDAIANVEVDLSNYYTKSEINSKGFITSIPAEYVTDTKLSNKGYATENWVNTQIANEIGVINNEIENIIG